MSVSGEMAGESLAGISKARLDCLTLDSFLAINRSGVTGGELLSVVDDDDPTLWLLMKDLASTIGVASSPSMIIRGFRVFNHLCHTIFNFVFLVFLFLDPSFLSVDR
jgi:hypothetical protein